MGLSAAGCPKPCPPLQLRRANPEINKTAASLSHKANAMAKLSPSKILRTSRAVKILLASIFAINSAAAYADDLPKWNAAITKYNEKQVRNFHPIFDFDSDGCYPATPFD